MKTKTLNIFLLSIMLCGALISSSGCLSKKHEAVLTMYEYDKEVIQISDHKFTVWNYIIDERKVHFTVDKNGGNPEGYEVDFGKLNKIKIFVNPEGLGSSSEEAFEVGDCFWTGDTGFQQDHRHITCKRED